MSVTVVFDTHATSVDNERGIATGWLPGELSAAGRDQARRRAGRGLHVRPSPGRRDGRDRVRRVGASGDERRAAARVRLRLDVIGYVATKWALEHTVRGVPIEALAAETFVWQPGWEYTL